MKSSSKELGAVGHVLPYRLRTCLVSLPDYFASKCLFFYFTILFGRLCSRIMCLLTGILLLSLEYVRCAGIPLFVFLLVQVIR